MGRLVIARKVLPTYGGDGIENHVEIGRVFRLKGLRNDDILVDLRYVSVVEGDDIELHRCDGCGFDFDSEATLQRHRQQMWHDREGATRIGAATPKKKTKKTEDMPDDYESRVASEQESIPREVRLG